MNYNERARTNYFKVKDKDALERFAEVASVQVDWEGELACIIAQEGIPSMGYDEELEDDVDINFADEVCKFLADGEILVLQGSGYEGMRCVTGWSTAYDNTGKTVNVDINEIYDKAARAFKVKKETIRTATS